MPCPSLERHSTLLLLPWLQAEVWSCHLLKFKKTQKCGPVGPVLTADGCFLALPPVQALPIHPGCSGCSRGKSRCSFPQSCSLS